MPCIEIGGNYSLSTAQINGYYQKVQVPFDHDFFSFRDVLFTSSGRSAISIAIHSMNLEGRIVLLPNFTCESISFVFGAHGCRCEFYKINTDLSIDKDDLIKQIEHFHPASLFLCSLFGFHSLENIVPIIPWIKKQKVTIIEDVTHSMIGDRHDIGADVIVGSIRKWLEIPEGGFVGGVSISKETFYTECAQDEKLVDNFVQASIIKNQYLNTNDDSLKELFRPKYYKNEDILYKDLTIYRMNDFSQWILQTADWDLIRNKRRDNYHYLLSHLHSLSIETVFPCLPEGIVPLFYPIKVKNGHRTELQKELMKLKIYCPIIWPIPPIIENYYSEVEIMHHRDILSLVIDQRYDFSDMDRIINCINNF